MIKILQTNYYINHKNLNKNLKLVIYIKKNQLK